MTRFDAAAALAPLKDFQRATAEHVYRRLYTDDDAVRRFLIADEVGLGKTLVARGVIAKAIEHLQDVVERVDVVYVCSNALIARQNVQRLRVGTQEHMELAERITMLPATAHRLSVNKVNLVSFTPGTSFELTGGSGQARERALLRLMLREVWGSARFGSRGSLRVFQGGVRSLDRFADQCERAAHQHATNLDRELVAKFATVLDEHDAAQAAAGHPTMLERFEELCRTFAWARPVSGWSRRERAERNDFVGDLRDLLARACLEALRPDLIVLDEFQRFKHLLANPGSAEASPASELAHELFDHVDRASGSPARVLLLSATPYKMLTRQADEEDHHDDLVETVRFLLDGDDDAVETLRRDLRGMRRGLLQAGRDGGVAGRASRDAVESTLRRVMVRSERLAATPDRSGMLAARDCDDLDLDLDAGEVGRYVAGARLARDVGAPDPLEYWKSAPYLLNFAEHYRLREAFDEAVAANPARVASLASDAGVLPFDRVRAFEDVPIEHPRLRWLASDTVGRGAWKLLWIPPSLPYLEPARAYADPQLTGVTKRLVFSSWTMVPTAIATLLTYQAERRMVTGNGRPRYRNSPEARQGLARLLEFTYSNERHTGMPVLGMLYPSVALARLGDPLALSRDHGGAPVDVDEAVAAVAHRVRDRLDELAAHVEEDGGQVPRSGREDERWYWAAPILLDWLDNPGDAEAMFAKPVSLRDAFTAGQTIAGGRFRDHIAHAREFLLRGPPPLGPMPDDLPEVLARMALAAPGVAALRALARATGRRIDEMETRRAACRAAWGFRSLFNVPEVTELVRHLHPGEPYWQRVIDYSLDGNLQAVLDEYAHVLVSARGHLDPSGDDVLDDLAEVIHDTVSLRTVRYGVSRIDVADGRVDVHPDKLRANFALRLSNERNDDGSQTRLGDVREAFNSPFRPFVLATTSAGQEGLDFHPYSHAVVHWNLPSNPVDLEQREGRVHRFQGHAIRRNVADTYGSLGRATSGDPWTAMFNAAHSDRDPEHTDIVPYWIYSGGNGADATVDRYVPALPLSRDRARTEALERAVASYRLAFGQPRQDELLTYLADEIDPETLTQLAGELHINIAPRSRHVQCASDSTHVARSMDPRDPSSEKRSSHQGSLGEQPHYARPAWIVEEAGPGRDAEEG